MKNKGKVAAIILMSGVCIFTGCNKATTGNDYTYVNLEEYYNVQNENEYAIVVNGENVGTALKMEGKLYLPQETVALKINSQFYYDEENKEIRYCTPTEIIKVKADGSDKLVITKDGNVYLEYNYVLENSNVKMKQEKEPDRVVVFTDMDGIMTYKVTEDSKVFKEALENSSVMADVKKGDVLYEYNTTLLYGNTVESENSVKTDFIKVNEGYKYVMTKDGVAGFIQDSMVTEGKEEVFKPAKEQEEHTYNLMDGKVCLAWHQVGNQEGNNELLEEIKGADSLNVISPTWFSVTDEDGNISSIASKKYVDTANKNGLKVWGLISDFEYKKDENNKAQYYINKVLENTKSRETLINNLISEAKEVGLDGINIDFEHIALENGRDYVQFMRELSIECRKSNLVLSVDLYVPMSFNQYYRRADIGEIADYMIVMGYDEHWSGSDKAGSVASVNYVENGIRNTVKCVDANRVINAVPFFTRIWTEVKEEAATNEDKKKGVFVEDNVNGNYYLLNRSVGMPLSEQFVREWGTQKHWVENVGQNYAEYKDGDRLNRVWLEDEKSLEVKISKMKEANLGGIACWKIGFEKKEVWDVIGAYVNQ